MISTTRARSDCKPMWPDVRIACDSLVALPVATADRTTLFAKNSDRPAEECQPLVQFPRTELTNGSTVRCQYLEIPQVAQTYRVIGSQPFWLWGFEHGLNERGVAIGNHTVFTRDALPSVGLTGMDLVRLGLERGRDARNAVSVITDLIATHGQGGSGYFDKDWPYTNSFLIADSQHAFLLETSGLRWALREINDVASATNHLTIGTDWTELSVDAVDHATRMGWSNASGDRFDFAAAYRDSELAPPVVSSGRYGRSCALLASTRGSITPDSLIHALRDHYGSVAFLPGTDPMDEQMYSLCMHTDPVGTTTASIVARLSNRSDQLHRAYVSLGSPCLGVFLPVFIDGDLPSILARGGEHDSDDSPWWLFKRLLGLVERDFPRFTPIVQERWAPLELALASSGQSAEEAAVAGRSAGDREWTQPLTTFMNEATSEILATTKQLVSVLSAEC